MNCNTTIFLALIGILGIALQVGFKLYAFNRGRANKHNLKTELIIIILSLITVVATSLVPYAITPLQLSGKWLAVGTFTIGYMTYSLLSKLISADIN